MNKRLLITGGTGSFGNTILRHFLNRSEYSEIVIFSRDEKKQDDMRHYYSNDKLRFEIGDVRDTDRVSEVLKGIDYVFHAAALKQVPSSEKNPLEYVKTNILGTSNIVSQCVNSGVNNLVVLSTDKAVMPINSMGISKAMSEKIALAQSVNQNGTKITCTRYGNVLASRGSVLPLFVKQVIEQGKVTITDPSMTRFLMSLDDSVDLVSHAFEENKTGKLYVKKAPAAEIDTIFKAVKEILGVKCTSTIIGARHGEKKHETLVSQEEMLRCIDEGNYFCITTDQRTLNYNNYVSSQAKSNFPTDEEYNSGNTKRLTVSDTVELLQANKEFLEIIKAYGY